MSTEEMLSEKEFFSFYFSPESASDSVFPRLKERYKAYKYQSYSTPKAISEVNYVKKFEYVCNYACFVGALKA
jgi:hypothetical protein